jgi:hypothetical protein
MSRRFNVLAWLSLVGGAMVAGETALEAQEGFAPPKPGPEHALLKSREGTWENTVKMMMPGMPAKETKGTATFKMECNGLWLVGNFVGEFDGKPFQGKQLDSYDAGKKKYVSVWIDSMGTLPMNSEGTYDKEKKTLTMVSEYPGLDGKPTKYTMVTQYKDDDTMLWSMSMPGKDGKDVVMMTITYKRKK